MSGDIAAVPVAGTWWRHVPAGGDPLWRRQQPGSFRWQRGTVVEGFYLAADEATVWAEWYRWLAEAGVAPRVGVPRELWRSRWTCRASPIVEARRAWTGWGCRRSLLPAGMAGLSGCRRGAVR